MAGASGAETAFGPIAPNLDFETCAGSSANVLNCEYPRPACAGSRNFPTNATFERERDNLFIGTVRFRAGRVPTVLGTYHPLVSSYVHASCNSNLEDGI